MSDRWKKIQNVVGATCAAIVLVIGSVMVVHPAISELAGLAVAQTATQWNNVRDAAAGDNLSNGIFASALYMFNGTAFDRARGDTTNGLDVDVTRMPGGAQTPADAFANPTTFQGSWSLAGLFNGSTWDRIRGISAANNTATTSLGAQYMVPLSTWNVTDTDSGATQSTATRAAGGGTVRHVATTVTICRGDTSAAAPALIHLRDGASGAGTILRSWVIGVAAGLSRCEQIAGLNITGSANTAMTIEFAAAGAASSISTVSLSGYSTP